MMTSLDLYNIALAGVFLFTFLMIYQRRWGEKLLRIFAPYWPLRALRTTYFNP